jgi:hypothetical protein
MRESVIPRKALPVGLDDRLQLQIIFFTDFPGPGAVRKREGDRAFENLCECRCARPGSHDRYGGYRGRYVLDRSRLLHPSPRIIAGVEAEYGFFVSKGLLI